MNLGNVLRQMRKKQKYTQQQMVDFVGVHRTTYVRYESGEVDPSSDVLCHIADIFGCTTDRLLGRE